MRKLALILALSLCGCATVKSDAKIVATDVGQELKTACEGVAEADAYAAIPQVAVYAFCTVANKGDESKCSAEAQAVKDAAKDAAAQCALAMLKDAQAKIVASK